MPLHEFAERVFQDSSGVPVLGTGFWQFGRSELGTNTDLSLRILRETDSALGHWLVKAGGLPAGAVRRQGQTSLPPLEGEDL